MKVTFYSNYLSVHQVPFCNEMYELLKEDFCYVSCEKIYPFRLKAGYKDLDYDYPYVLRKYENDESYKKAQQLSIESDVVLIGSAPEEFVRKRLLKYNKLTFRYTERPLKTGINVNTIIYMLYRNISYIHKNMYLLAAGYYCYPDFKKFHCYKNKAYQWGYFTKEIKEERKQLNSVINILWVGRLITWKHPEFAVRLAKRLKEMQIPFDMTIAGNGEMMEEINKLGSAIPELHIIGALSNDEILSLYSKFDIFTMTSNQQEGWGAVINEAMSAKCAVVASATAGASRVLIENGVNGLLYENDSYEDFEDKVVSLLKHPESIKKLGDAASKTIDELWNGKVAASRLIELSSALLGGKEVDYNSGPCIKIKP